MAWKNSSEELLFILDKVLRANLWTSSSGLETKAMYKHVCLSRKEGERTEGISTSRLDVDEENPYHLHTGLMKYHHPQHLSELKGNLLQAPPHHSEKKTDALISSLDPSFSSNSWHVNVNFRGKAFGAEQVVSGGGRRATKRRHQEQKQPSVRFPQGRGSSSVLGPTQASSHTHSLIEPPGQLEGSPASPHSD
ncbi:hypothetical protein EYF80_007843 [Liparis tanakae]|uniref:Uncharacterized protein n=1 Tax=Liparis tanakae TaxID=230148 RepID=A0A4Z2IVE9_9TELE|nr:hypothetical protein EYF80_007843 [Liparis tanakae]